MSIGRRKFLLLGISGATAAIGLSSPAEAATPTVQSVWRLNARWGYAVPPKGRTSCRCNACHRHAENMLYVSQAAAVAGRIHPCCVCQPFGVQLSVDDVNSLFPGGLVEIDLRDGDNLAAFQAAVARSLAPPPAAPAAPGDAAPAPVVAAPVVATPTSTPAAASRAPVAPTMAPIASSEPVAGQLPATGADSRATATAAALLVGIGAITAIAANRSHEPDASICSATPDADT